LIFLPEMAERGASLSLLESLLLPRAEDDECFLFLLLLSFRFFSFFLLLFLCSFLRLFLLSFLSLRFLISFLDFLSFCGCVGCEVWCHQFYAFTAFPNPRLALNTHLGLSLLLLLGLALLLESASLI
jgi:hypothetical protein